MLILTVSGGQKLLITMKQLQNGCHVTTPVLVNRVITGLSDVWCQVRWWEKDKTGPTYRHQSWRWGGIRQMLQP